MKSHELKSLQTLRQLREQRASAQLAAQRQLCRETHAALDDARQRLCLARETSVLEAEKLYGRFSEGLSVKAWLAAQVHLSELEDEQETLLGNLDEAHDYHQQQEQTQESLRLAHVARQRQADAWDSLVEDHALGERRIGEAQDEGEDLFAPLLDLTP